MYIIHIIQLICITLVGALFYIQQYLWKHRDKTDYWVYQNPINRVTALVDILIFFDIIILIGLSIVTLSIKII